MLLQMAILRLVNGIVDSGVCESILHHKLLMRLTFEPIASEAFFLVLGQHYNPLIILSECFRPLNSLKQSISQLLLQLYLSLSSQLACQYLWASHRLSVLQQQAKYASPVSSIAERASLPSSLVDIRHAATHNQLPSLPTLLHAADQALR